MTKTRILLAALGVALLAVPAALGADSVYWTNNFSISSAALDGSAASNLTISGATVNIPEGIAFDPAAGRMYWANSNANKISVADPDGSSGSDLTITGTATVNRPVGIAVDPAAGRIYWANYDGNKISYVNLGGSNSADLVTTGATVNKPDGVALDPAADRIYWASQNANKISYANLDGSGGGDLDTTGATVNAPQGVALDKAAGRIYWANGSGNKISYTKLDGTGGGGDLSTSGATALNNPDGVAVDPGAGRIYWANINAHKISYAKLDGTGGGGDVNTGGATVDGYKPALLKAPSGTGVPAVTGGATLGSVLSCSQGSWASDLTESLLYRAPRTFAYQWARNGTDVGGAASSTLTPTTPGSYTCRVTATNYAGSTQQTSAGHGVFVTLTVAKAGSGSGSVTSSPSGIDCGATCSDQLADVTSITLTATPASGSSFQGWSGGGCSGTSTCMVTVDADKTVTATFETDKTLTVSKAGDGAGSVSSSPTGIDCGATCAHAYTHGTSVTLTATAATGSSFAGWSGGGCSGTSTCTLTVDAGKTVTATFESDRLLSVLEKGDGRGSVTSSPAGIACGATCAHVYTHGTSVTLTPTPASTSTFAGWSGDCSGTGACVLAMSADRAAAATFLAKCVVPKVKGKRLAAAKRALTRAHCSTGKVRKSFSSKRRGRVLAQKPRPGTKLPRGAKVALTVSKGARR